MAYRLFGILLLFFSPVAALASNTMFEGYYRIELGKKSIGYTVVRFAYDPKTKSFSSISFLRTHMGNEVYQESITEKSNNRFEPISYHYTSQDGDAVKTIDATFKGQIMKLLISDGKKLRRETDRVPKGTFLSSFLPYLMLQKKLRAGEGFRYSGIAEEDGNSYWGKAVLESKSDNGRYQTFKVVNSFKGKDFTSTMAVIPDAKVKDKYQKGEVTLTYSPTQDLSVRLVATPAEATAGHLVPNKILTTLFGGVPLGKDNMISTPPEPPPKMIPSPVPPQKQGA